MGTPTQEVDALRQAELADASLERLAERTVSDQRGFEREIGQQPERLDEVLDSVLGFEPLDEPDAEGPLGGRARFAPRSAGWKSEVSMPNGTTAASIPKRRRATEARNSLVAVTASACRSRAPSCLAWNRPRDPPRTAVTSVPHAWSATG